MNSLGLGFWTTGIAASILFTSGAPRAPSQTNEGRLVRIAPRPSAPQSGAAQGDASTRVPVERFEDWSSRLTSDDLDERERAFDEIVAAARRNQDLRETLAEWSRDESKRDLANRIVGSGEARLTDLSLADLRELVALSEDAVAEG